MSGGDTFIQEQIDMDEQSIYQKTLRLARLIGLDHHGSDVQQKVWRQVKQPSAYPRMRESWQPWLPYECEADLEPIKRWLKMHHPDWQRITGCDVESEHCRTFCNAVLAAFDWQKVTISELHPVGTDARHRSQIQRLSRLRRAARRLAKRKVAKASGRGETIRRLLKELQTSSYAKDWACEEVAKHQGEISRLRFQLQRATADAETYLRIGRERGEKIDKLTDILQRLYDYHDAPAKCNAEYMEAVAEAGDVLQTKDQLADLAEQCDACKPMAFTAEYQKEIDCLRAQLADIDNATKVAMDERCDAYDKHCSCVPLLRAKVKHLTNLLDRFRAEVRMYCRPGMVQYDVFPVFKEVDDLFAAEAAERGEG